MWIARRLIAKKLGFRSLSSQSTAAVSAVEFSDSSPWFQYLEGFPRPDPKYAETILAAPRTDSGKKVSAKERKAGRVPSIVFEQENGQEDFSIWRFDPAWSPRRFLRRSACCRAWYVTIVLRSKIRILGFIHRVEFRNESLIHLHAGTDEVLNVTFLRAPSHSLLKIDVPLVFRGEEISPGLKKGAYLNVIKRTVKYRCPADIVPPYIDVDLSELDAGQKVLAGDLKVHPALQLLRPAGEPVCKIMGIRVEPPKKSK